MLMSANERTGWRDSRLSLRHREWGSDCPAVDIDFLMIEYDKAEPRGLVEYKHEYAAPVEVEKNTSIKAIRLLASRAGLPAFIVRYADDFSWWKVGALNAEAANYLQAKTVVMDEASWVRTLYEVRGRTLPESIREKVENLPHEPSERTECFGGEA